jgi:prephenate dehydrogenase
MKIAILGAVGGMGGWLIRYFSQLGHTVIASDPNINELRCSVSVEVAADNKSAVHNVDLVVVSVPMGITADVIREVVPYVRKGTILCEIASMKTKAYGALKEATTHSVRPLSIHPLFGPGAIAIDKRIALIPVLDLNEEKKLVDSLFPDAKIITVEAEKHDRIMAVTLSLPYFVNMVIASLLKDEDITILAQLSGTAFTLQLVLVGSIMFHSPAFHAALYRENPHASNVLKNLLSAANTGFCQLADGDLDSFKRSYNSIKEALAKGMNLQEKYDQMYDVLEALDAYNGPEVGI